MSNKLSSTIIRLLIANMSYRAATIIMKIFLNIFILQLTGDIRIVALFSLLALGFHMIAYIGNSYILQYGFRNLAHYSSMFVSSFMLLTLALNPELIGTYYVLYGMMYGLCSGVYWSTYNMNQFDFTVPKNRGNFEGIKKSIRTSISIGIPILIGSIIVWNPFSLGYNISFFLAALCSFVAAILGSIDEAQIQKNTGRLRLRRYLRQMKQHPDMWKIWVVNILISFALSMPLLELLFPLILHTDGFNEAKIGIFISITSFVSIIVSYVFGKYVSYKHYKRSFVIGAILYTLSIGGVIVSNSQLLIYAFIPFASILYVLVDIPRSVFSMNVLHELEDYKTYRGEHMLVSEIPIIFGRSLISALLLLSGVLNQETVHVIFICMGIAMIFALISFTTINKIGSDA